MELYALVCCKEVGSEPVYLAFSGVVCFNKATNSDAFERRQRGNGCVCVPLQSEPTIQWSQAMSHTDCGQVFQPSF